MEKTKENEKSKENSHLFYNKNSDIKLVESCNQNATQCNERRKRAAKSKPGLLPPDGGWGWMVVIGGFLSILLSSFPLFSFSILYSPILMSSGVTSSTTAWIYNVHGLVWSIYTVLIGPLCEEYGWRKISIIGGIANFLSIFLSAFVTRAELLFFTFSVFGGIGGSTGFVLCNFVVSRYFIKHRGFALAIASLGGTASSFFSPLLAFYLLENYGFMGASFIYGATILNQCVGGALFQPVEWHMKPAENEPNLEDSEEEDLLKTSKAQHDSLTSKEFKEYSQIESKKNDFSGPTANALKEESPIHGVSRELHRKNIWLKFIKIIKLSYANLKALHHLRVKLIAVGHACLHLGYLNFQMWIPFVVTNTGFSLEVAAWCISISSISNVIGRITMSILSDRKWFNVRYGYMLGVFFIGIFTIAFAFAYNVQLFMVCVFFWGFGVGIALSLNINTMIIVMGVKMLPALLGVSSLFKGLIGIVVGPLIGFARDSTSSYTYTICLLGGIELIGLFLWLLMPLALNYDKNRMKANNETEIL